MNYLGPGRILKIMGAFMQSKILLVANKLNVFEVIGDEEINSMNIANKLNLKEEYCTVLLNSLASIGLLCKKGDLYSNSNDVKEFLIKGSSNYLGDLLLFQENEWISWQYLYETISTGSSKGSDFNIKMEDEELKTYIKAMDESGRYSSKIIPHMVDLKGKTSFLDLGCGSGIFGKSFSEYYPKLKIDFLDYPEVIELTKRYLKDYEKYNYISTDYHNYNVTKKYDCIFCSHNIHQNSAQENIELFKKVYKALNKDGFFVIHDFIVDETEINPSFSAIFSVNMILQSDGGKTYSIKELKSWLEECGFVNVEYKSLGIEIPSSIIVAEKR